MRRAHQVIGLLFVCLAGTPLTGTALAGESRVEVLPLAGKKLRVDGMLREWPGRMTKLSSRMKGRAGASASGMIGFDKKNVYVAMDVKDSKFVRTRGYGGSEDYASLVLAFPTASGSYKTYEVKLYAGEPGRIGGAVKIGDRKISGAKIVEAPSRGGYVFEASIPWRAFPDARWVRVGLRGALRYSAAGRGIIATSNSRGKAMPRVLLDAEYAIDTGLVQARNLRAEPKFEVFGNVSGSGTWESVAVYDKYLTIAGSQYRRGNQFFFRDLAVDSAHAVKSLKLMELTGDSRKEIVLRLKFTEGPNHRDVLQVLSVPSGSDEPFVALQQELGIYTPDLSIQNKLQIKTGKSLAIIVSQGKVTGVDPKTYDEPKAAGMKSAIMPWSKVEVRTYEWDGDTFSSENDKHWQPKMSRPRRGRRKMTASRSSSSSSTGGSPGSSRRDGPPPPRPPSVDELLDRVYGLYRQDRGLGKSRASFDFVTDVAADQQTERVLVHGKDLVVFGKGYKNGNSYAYTTMGVKEASHIKDVTARDITGDGKAEIIVRGIIHARASKKRGGDVVSRHAFFVYKVSSGGIQRIFAAETGRSLGKNAIIATLRFTKSDNGFDIELHPGRAIGWSRKNYPFPVDRHPYGGLEPLPVPWRELPALHYHYDGGRYVKKSE